MLGDSLSRQQFYSLVCLLDAYGVAPERVTYPECGASCAILTGDEPEMARLLRTHDIVLAEVASHHLNRLGGNARFFPVLEQLLNALTLRETRLANASTWFGSGVWLRTRDPRHFPTSNPPHPKGPVCHNVTKPPGSLHYRALEDAHTTPLQNCALHSLQKLALLEGWNILETEALSFHRADQHYAWPSPEARGSCDLSHWCAAGSAPSVPDTWNLLWLKQLTSQYLASGAKPKATPKGSVPAAGSPVRLSGRPY